MGSLQYLKVVFCSISLTELTSFLFWVLCCEVFKFWVNSFDGLWNKEWQEPNLGDSQGTPRYNSRTPKSLSLGMPRKATPLSSSSISNFTCSYIFIRHMICVLLGASFYLLLLACCLKKIPRSEIIKCYRVFT